MILPKFGTRVSRRCRLLINVMYNSRGKVYKMEKNQLFNENFDDNSKEISFCLWE